MAGQIGSVNMDPNADAFSPKTVSAGAGQTVTWTNLDMDVHTVTPDSAGGPDSSALFPNGLATGDTYTWTVPANAASGTKFYYHCSFHGAAGNGSSFGAGMSGVVAVP